MERTLEQKLKDLLISTYEKVGDKIQSPGRQGLTPEQIVEERAEHFINFFGDYALTAIQKTRDGGNYFNEELFQKVEEMLQK